MAKLSPNMMIERADEYRALATQRRNRGLHHGASAKGWAWTRPDLDRDDWHGAFRATLNEWQSAVSVARNDFAVACLNGTDQMEDFV